MKRFLLVLAAIALTWVNTFTAFADLDFSAARTFETGFLPYSVTISDLDGDTVLDLAVANSGSDSVSIFLGNGDGSFAAAVNYNAGDQPYSVAISDLDGDTVPDLAVANYWSDNVSILLGNGDGTFALPLITMSETRHTQLQYRILTGTLCLT